MSRFVINVTLNAERLFSTNRAAAITKETVQSVVTCMKAGFPESDGYKVEAFCITTNSTVEPVLFDTEALLAAGGNVTFTPV